MIDHVNLPVSDLDASFRFYETVLNQLGHAFLLRDGDAIGFGNDAWRFGIVQESAPIPMHIAFTAQSADAVRAFHRAALSAGAQDNGAPGYREHYGPAYYAAFVLDPDGHNIEAVCRHVGEADHL